MLLLRLPVLALAPLALGEAAGPALPKGAVYLQCDESGGGRKDLKGDWLSFSGLDMKYYAPSELSGRAPFLLVPAPGTPGGFSLQNLWEGYTEGRFGYFVSVTSAGALVLVPPTDTAGRAVFTAAAVGAGGTFALQSGAQGWVGPTPADDVKLVAQGERSTWTFVAAPDAMLPPSGPPVFFQVASGTHKNDWVGFSSLTVCCGSCANTEDERGVWGLIPANASAPDDKVYYIMNL